MNKQTASDPSGMVKYLHQPPMYDPWEPAKTDVCHCGEPVVYGFDGDPYHHRGMCELCDAVRCDAYPGECRR